MRARVEQPGSPRDRRLYGWCAFVLGAFLVWFAAWTVACNALVLTHWHYPAFRWAALPPTLLVAALIPFRRLIVDAYALPADDRAVAEPPPRLGGRDRAMLAAAFLLALLAADLGNRWPTALPYMAACVVAACLVGTVARRQPAGWLAPPPPAIGWRLPVLVLLLLAIYYGSHRVDEDDANFINLALGAQRTRGAVFQLDTMLGDGPGPIHLPTYKLHAFELLGAVLSSLTGLAPIAIFHLVLPAILLPLLGLVLLVMLVPVVGRYWLAAALLWLAFLFLDATTYASWGVHGPIRFFQGKGFLVAALLPLTAGLAVRWFRRGQAIDLAALALAMICAIGFSANGLYGGPLAIAFVAGAAVATAPRSAAVWRRALLLVPTCAYPIAIALLVLLLHLALPSEVTTPTVAIEQLDAVAGYGPAGRLVLALLACAGLGLVQLAAGPAALAYVPLAMLLTLNPVGWHLASAISGNLGFRIFWSLPAATLAALTGVALARAAGLRSEPAMTALGGLALAGAIGFLGHARPAADVLRWHRPDLKVIRPDYDLAGRLAARTAPGCRILAPETYSALLTTMRGAPYPVFARALYLVHYRFTMPPAERALRERLRQVVDGPAPIPPPAPAALAAIGIPIGTVAVREDAPSRPSAERLAESLRLRGPARDGPLLVWTGRCGNDMAGLQAPSTSGD